MEMVRILDSGARTEQGQPRCLAKSGHNRERLHSLAVGTGIQSDSNKRSEWTISHMPLFTLPLGTDLSKDHMNHQVTEKEMLCR